MYKLFRALNDKYTHQCNLPSDINEHLPTLYEYASGCEHITEMGVRWIVSTWALLNAKPKKMVSYDIVSPDIFGADIGEVKRLANVCCIEYDFIIGDVLKLKSIETTDLLFIDTLHTYKQLMTELYKFHSSVKKYIILHDTLTFGYRDEKKTDYHKIGLQQAIIDFIADHGKDWYVRKEYKNNNGLTILQRRESNGS